MHPTTTVEQRVILARTPEDAREKANMIAREIPGARVLTVVRSEKALTSEAIARRHPD
jgi:hypothetical protein